MDWKFQFYGPEFTKIEEIKSGN